MKRKNISYCWIFAFALSPFTTFSQGLINNGAHIVISSGVTVFVNTAGSGTYTSQAGGIIDNNTTGGTINVQGNWVNNAANVGFSNDGSNVILSGANQSVGGTNSTTFYNLSLQGSGTKTLNVNTTVGGISTLTGVLSLSTLPLDLNSFLLSVSNPTAGAITNTTGYIQSETNVSLNPSQVKWIVGTSTGARIIPFGLATAQIPFTMNITSGMSAANSSVTVSTRATLLTNNTPWSSTVTHMYDPTIGGDGSVPAVIDRWWDLTWSNAATATLTFSYRGAENTLSVPYNTGNIGAQYWAAAWLPNNSNIGSAPAVLAGVGTVTAPGIAFVGGAYTPMVLSSLSAPLPIELTKFNANCNATGEIISWSTASELNNNFFTVERCDDGINFYNVGNVNGSGTTSQLHNYSFTDPSPISSTIYYRLRQTDYNGSFTESPIINGESCNGTSEFIDAFSSDNGISVTVNTEEASDYDVAVYDMQGKIIFVKNISAAKGSNLFLLDNSIPATGIYLIRVTNSNGKSFGKKLLLEKK